jgi:DNA-directed RNA polymerase beta' subunit
LEEVVQPLLYKIVICGIQGIEAVYFKEDFNSFETDGSNFQQLMGLPFVDSNKTLSNNVWDIYNILGVEAARLFLVEEFMGIMEGINRCHIQLLAEKMTHGGAISSISRYTMRTEECGPLGRCSFEETMDNFLKAGIYGQDEDTKGVSSSIICGKRSQIGTGFCELRMDVDALPGKIKILNEVEENINVVTPKYSTLTNKLHKNNIEPSNYIPRKIKETKKNSDDKEFEQTTYLDF